MKDLLEKIDWENDGGLIPAIIQDTATTRVLMLGYMNREALSQTIKTGKVTFFSRSKKRLWTKGETSDNFLLLDNIKIDCDNDTLLIKARPQGPTCHNGIETCFGEDHDGDFGFLGTLENIIAQRASDDPEKSYVANLLSRGIEKVAQKVGEEGVETALAAMSPGDRLAEEAADLIFHLLILLKTRNLLLSDISEILEKRHRN